MNDPIQLQIISSVTLQSTSPLHCVQMFELNMHFIISVKVIFATYKNLIIPTMFELTKKNPCTLVSTHASNMLLHGVFF